MKLSKFCKDFNTKSSLIEDIPNPNEPTEATLAIHKAWVQSLAQSNKGRDYIYKNLLASIIKILDYSRPFWTEDISSEKVREAFEFIITTYPADSVWLATYRVLGWCNLEKSDYVMYRYIENTVRQTLEKKKNTTTSFKETLKQKADDFEKQTNVSAHIEVIKKKMEKIATQRKFYIYLIESTGTSTLAFSDHESTETIFIPKGIVSWKYVQVFKEALKELGFDSNDGISSTSIQSYDNYDRWTITLEW